MLELTGHPHVVQCFGAVEGGTLWQLIRGDPWPTALRALTAESKCKAGPGKRRIESQCHLSGDEM